MSSNETIRIALIDDHTLFRSGIKALLTRQDNYEVVGEAADGLSGVKLVEQTDPDVVLLDLDMPVMNGREALAQILSSRSEQVVVMLTVSEDSEDLTECMRLGARGFLLKNIHADFLVDAIRKAAEGDTRDDCPLGTIVNPAQYHSGGQCIRRTDNAGIGNSRPLGCRTQQQNHCTQTQSGGIHHQSACTEHFTQT